MSSSPEPLLHETRRVLVQTPLPFRSMTAVHCGRGCACVALLMSKRSGNARDQLGVNSCAI